MADVLAQVVYHELVAAVEETNTDILMGEARRIRLGERLARFGRPVEPLPMPDDLPEQPTETRATLRNPFAREREASMSAIDRIRAKALQARNIAPTQLKKLEADLDALNAEESVLDQKRVAAVSLHQEAITGIKGEIDGLKSAIDILSNGEPA